MKSIVTNTAPTARYICLFESIPKNAFADIHVKIKTVQTTGGDVQSKSRSTEDREWKSVCEG